MNKIPLVFILIIIIGTSGCEDRSEEQYMYTKPVATVYDTLIGQPARLGSVELKNLLIEVNTPYVRHYVSNFHFSFVNSAYAMTKKNELRGTTIEKTTTMRIITLRNYNANYTAGSDISPICRFYGSYKNPDSTKNNPLPDSKKIMTMAQVIGKMNMNRGNILYYDYASPLSGFVFIISEAPATQSEQQFAIVFETATPSRYSDTTDSFTLKP